MIFFSTVRIKKYTDPGTLKETFYEKEKVILHQRMIWVNILKKNPWDGKNYNDLFCLSSLLTHCVRLMKRIFNSKCIFIAMIDLTTPSNRIQNQRKVMNYTISWVMQQATFRLLTVNQPNFYVWFQRKGFFSK